MTVSGLLDYHTSKNCPLVVICDQLILIYSHNKIIFALNPRFTEIGKYPKMIPWVQKVLFNLFWSKLRTKLIHVGFSDRFRENHFLWNMWICGTYQMAAWSDFWFGCSWLKIQHWNKYIFMVFVYKTLSKTLQSVLFSFLLFGPMMSNSSGSESFGIL